MKLAIIGSGYVGLPLAIEFSKYFNVTCFDINKNRINELKKGIDQNHQHKKNEILKKSLIFTYNENQLRDCDIYIVTVPTPINKSNKPDLKMLKDASILVGKNIKKKSIVIYESTTYPGCTEEFCLPLLEKYSKLKFNSNFYVAYSPERVNPGDKVNNLGNITKIVGANDKKTQYKVKKLYDHICKSIYVVNSIKVAESAKVIENTQRDINIALINEFSKVFNLLKIPTNEVLKAAASKWNFHYYKPGLVGGHCISVDPYYIAYKALKHNYYPKVILSGRKFNEDMSKYVAKETIKLLLSKKIKLNKARVAVLGFSFKENIPDTRNTKIFQLVEGLKNQNIKFNIFDSIVSKQDVKKKYKIQIYNFSDLGKFKYDAIILSVSHKSFLKNISYYNKFYKNKKNKIFIDLKNNYSRKNLIKNKFEFFQL